ncbi:MAG TPA: arginase family protein [Thermoanaerobaculia bacterium]|nr:arginase family protein [Thermoanaerobaculia bacterium]
MSIGTVEILRVPYDVERRDTPTARGVRGLLEHGFADRLRAMDWEVRETEVAAPAAGPKLQTVLAILRQIASFVERVEQEGSLSLILSGGCLASLGVVAGLQRRGHDVGVVWIDAHGDCNTPATSPSGYWDGMALAALRGLSLPELRERMGGAPLAADAVIHLAGRAFDPLEAGNIESLGLACVPSAQLAAGETRELLRRASHDRSLYLHVDVDGIDPRDAPAVGFPVSDGVRLAEVLGCRDDLPPATAMTFSALSFDRATPDEAARTVDACLRLVGAFARHL